MAEDRLAELQKKLAALEDQRLEYEETCSDLRDKLDASARKCQQLQQAKDKLKVNVDLNKIVVVDGVPSGVPPAKHDRLKAFLKKFMMKPKGVRLKDITLGCAGGKTAGYAFAQYADVKSASDAAAFNQGKKLDKKHSLKTTLMGDFNKYDNVPDEFKEPEALKLKERPDLHTWLLDNKVRDQFVVRQGKDTMVYWNDPFANADKDGRVLVYGGDREKARGKTWTDSWIAWSPKGSYLATFHQQGIVLWGGDDFVRVGKYVHKGVRLVDFSPDENYLVTCNGRQDSKNGIIIWDIDSQKELRSFNCGVKVTWPIFNWSSDDKYTCRVAKDKISVYEVPSMNLLDKKSINLKAVQEVQFSPSDNVLAAWVPENGAIAASLHIIEVPSKKVVRERHFYNVNDLKLHWHPLGHFLCAKLARQKSKKTVVSSFEIFRMRSKNIPVEVMETDDRVVAFAWEPSGSCFAVAHGADPASGRNSVTIYSLQSHKLKTLKCFEGRPCNCLYWSPRGGTLILAGLGQLNGILEFVDVNTMTSLTTEEHFMCTDIEWDPSGRFCMTAVTQPLTGNDLRFAMENGYKLWTSHGKLLSTINYQQFYQIAWRPRPPTPFNEVEQKRIKKDLRSRNIGDNKEDKLTYWKKFEREDDRIRKGQLSGQEKELEEMKQAWKKYREQRRKDWKGLRSQREALLGHPENDPDDWEVKEVIIETVLSKKEERVARE